MKKIIFIFILTFISQLSFSQSTTSPCQPMPPYQFEKEYKRLISYRSSGEQLRFTLQLIKRTCLNSNQIQEIAMILDNESDKYEFCKEAVHRTSDPWNFYDVYDAFISFSHVFKLHEYVKQSGIDLAGEDHPSATSIKFPEYNYPDYLSYNGYRNCNRILPQFDFIQIAEEIDDIYNNQEKARKSIELMANQCPTTSQVMKIASLIKEESAKEYFVKEIYRHVYDRDNYGYVEQVFSIQNQDHKAFLNGLTGNSSSIGSDSECNVIEQELQSILSKIRVERVSRIKISVAQRLISEYKCLKASQIVRIIQLFDFENAKYTIARYAYVYCSNQDNYYNTVSKTFNNEINKTKLYNYINSR